MLQKEVMGEASSLADMPLMIMDCSTVLRGGADATPEREAAENRIMRSTAIGQEAAPAGRRADTEQREGVPVRNPSPTQAGRSRGLPAPHPSAPATAAPRAVRAAAAEKEAAGDAEVFLAWTGEKRSWSLQGECFWP